jgi:hypothetical protein
MPGEARQLRGNTRGSELRWDLGEMLEMSCGRESEQEKELAPATSMAAQWSTWSWPAWARA